MSNGDGTLAFEDLERHLGDAESRMPRADLPGDADTADVWLRALNTGDGRLRHGLDAVARSFPALGRGLAADRALQGSHATVHAGILGSKSSARSSQQVADRVFSASGLGDLGACPRRFLLKYVLKAYPPDDPDYDPHRWLNALDRGGVLHRVYERTLRKSRAAGVETDFDSLLALALAVTLEEAEKQLIHTPAPSDSVFQWERDALKDDVRSFVAMVCSHAPRWTHLEMQFGKEGGLPIEPGGRTILARGAVDRVDDHGTHLRVIDYKTGSSWSHGGKSGVYDGGRRFQHLVYVAACRAVLGRAADAMEYHFPTRKGENQIYRYEEESLADGGTLLADMLDGLAKGWFPATDKPPTDCRFCDYKEVCGVHESRRGATTSPHAAWSQRNLKELEELSVLKRVRQW